MFNEALNLSLKFRTTVTDHEFAFFQTTQCVLMSCRAIPMFPLAW